MHLHYIGLLIWSSALLNVTEGIQVDISEATDTTPVELNCSSSIEPYVWKYNGNKKSNSSVYIVTDNKATGVYTCTAGNITTGNSTTESYEAGNFSTPHIGHGEKSIKVTEGDSDITLSCSSYSYPTPKFTWESEKGSIEDNNTEYKIKTNGTHSELTIISVTMETRADYICTAKNWAGSGTATILVRVQNRLAPLWAFLAILAEVIIMAVITLVFASRRKQKKKAAGLSEPVNNEPRENDLKED